MVARTAGKGRLRRIAAGALRITGRVLLVVLLAVVVAAASMLLPGVRGRVLHAGLGLADGALPGRLSVDDARWPAWGVFELDGIVWCSDEGDTLAHVPVLRVGVDPVGLLRREDIVLTMLEVRAHCLDVPALAARFPAAAADSAATATAAPASEPWPRQGAVQGVPSLRLERVLLSGERITAAPGVEVRGLQADLAADVGAGATPRLLVRSLAGRALLDTLTVDVTSLQAEANWDTSTATLSVERLALVVGAAGPPAVVRRWQGQEPLTLDALGRVHLAGDRIDGQAELTVQLPGAPLLGDLWPTSLAPERFAAVRLAASVDLQQGPSLLEASGRVALDPLADVERLLVVGSVRLPAGQEPTVRLERLELAVDGLDLEAAGSLDGGVLDARFDGAVHTPVPLAEAFVPALAAWSGTAELEAEAAGPLENPTAAVDLRASVSGAALMLQDLHVQAQGSLAGVDAELTAGPTSFRGRRLTEAFAATVGAHDTGGADLRTSRRAALAVSARSRGGEDGVRGRVVGRALLDPRAPLGGSVELDTLAVEAPGLLVDAAIKADTTRAQSRIKARLATPCPLLELALPDVPLEGLLLDADVATDGPIRDPQVDLELVGSYDGTFGRVPDAAVTVHGRRSALRAEVRAGGGLVRGGRTLVDTVAVDLDYAEAGADSLPVRLGVFARQGPLAAGLLARVRVDSVAVAEMDSLGLELAGATLRLGAPATVRVDTAARRIEIAGLDLAGSAGMLALAGRLSPEQTELTSLVDLVLTEPVLQTLSPSPLWSRDGGLDLGVRGRVGLAILPDSTGFGGSVDVALRPHRDETDLGASLDFHLQQGEQAGLAADFAVTAADTALVGGRLLWPGRFDSAERRWLAHESGMIELEIAEQAVPLALLRRVMPPDMGVRGSLRMGAKAELPVAAADTTGGHVAGFLRAERLRLDLPGASRLEVSADLKAEGSPFDPRLSGLVTVPSGFIRIPELPRNLHPAEGEPALWVMAADDSLGAESAGLSARWGAGEQAGPQPWMPDHEVRVRVPGSLRIHGYGLDVEVAADVTSTRGFDAKGRPGPSLKGEAHSVQGTLRFMNRTFEIRQADVRFTGAVPPDPYLDIKLDTNISGTMIWLHVSGRASDPAIDLTSDPDMNEADIVAYLLFGRPLNDLDADQRGRSRDEADPAQQLRENLAGLALVFGTAGLQNSVSSSLGVDTIEVGTGSDGGSTLSAGKYIGPRMLLKYNASLEKAGSYFLSLEYALSQVFKVVTTYGEGDEASGLELKWVRRY